jgi:aminoglycoside 3-N-acetyltransferase
MMYAGWEDDTYHLAEWDAERRRAYMLECPPFVPSRSRANRRQSILTEYLRTWPGTLRSDHPEASVVALGSMATDFTRDHPRNYPYGPGSPLQRLVEAGGKVLLLGSPLERVTLLHLAENLAELEGKRVVRYRMPVVQGGQRVWESFEDFDTSTGVVAWRGEDYFGVIMRAFLAGGHGRQGWVGGAPSCLIDARELLAFAVPWMERNLQPAG